MTNQKKYEIRFHLWIDEKDDIKQVWEDLLDQFTMGIPAEKHFNTDIATTEYIRQVA